MPVMDGWLNVSEVKHLILADHSQAFEGKLLVLACASITFASAAEQRCSNLWQGRTLY